MSWNVLKLIWTFRPTHPESPEENFESLNPYDVNDDGRKDYSILKDPEFSFEEYLEMQRMMNQFVTRKIWSGDEMLKKCEKNYEAFKEFWKISGLRGHFVLFDNPRHWQKISTKNHSELIFRWTHCLKISNSVQKSIFRKIEKNVNFEFSCQN